MKTIRQQFSVSYTFPIIFTRHVFNEDNPVLAELFENTGEKPNRILPVIDSGVFDTTAKLMEKMERYADLHCELLEFVSSPVIIKGGELCKNNLSEASRIQAFIDKHSLCRHSYVLAIGGGAVLDTAGYAAATAHRGVRLIRMPTTTLAQNDAGIGVKNGINAFGRKNFLGTFAPPFAVINDFEFLKTLSQKFLRAGISEAIKVALIKDRNFFDFLYNHRHRLAAFEPDSMEQMIIHCAELHNQHIGKGGDPFESGSSRPLDFGHWSAHKIEEMDKGGVQHGEAVAIGVALDTLYSYRTGLISEAELQQVFTILEDVGFHLYHRALNYIDIAKALREFQEHLGGRLTLPLLNGLGEKIDVHEIDTLLLKKCVMILAERYEDAENKDDFDRHTDDSGRVCGIE